jgi:hypothetical protein
MNDTQRKRDAHLRGLRDLANRLLRLSYDLQARSETRVAGDHMRRLYDRCEQLSRDADDLFGEKA